MRRLFALLREQRHITDRHAWATDVLHQLGTRQAPVITYAQLSDMELALLIATLVPDAGLAKPCNQIGPSGSECIQGWPAHPAPCVDIHGDEWLPRDF